MLKSLQQKFTNKIFGSNILNKTINWKLKLISDFLESFFQFYPGQTEQKLKN